MRKHRLVVILGAAGLALFCIFGGSGCSTAATSRAVASAPAASGNTSPAASLSAVPVATSGGSIKAGTCVSSPGSYSTPVSCSPSGGYYEIVGVLPEPSSNSDYIPACKANSSEFANSSSGFALGTSGQLLCLVYVEKS